jgi:hypothetical protein
VGRKVGKELGVLAARQSKRRVKAPASGIENALSDQDAASAARWPQGAGFPANPVEKAATLDPIGRPLYVASRSAAY